MKKIISVFLLVVIMLTSVNITFAAEERKGPDLVITDVRISNPYFKSGDDLSFEIDLKNIGDEVCQSGWLWLSVKSGAVNREGSKNASKWSKKYLYPGDVMTWSIINFVAEDEKIEIGASCNSAGNITEANKSNNNFSVEFTSLKSNPNLEIKDIKVTPSEFKAGDAVELEVQLKNSGNMDIPYSEIDGEMLVNKQVIPFKTVQQLVAGEEVSFTLKDVAADDTHLDIQAEVNIEKTITEGDYKDNTFRKDIYSISEIDYDWDTVRVGGGGYVPHMALHKTDPDAVYIGTDVGGAHRYDHSVEEWIPITASLNFVNGGYNGIQGIATDPGDSDIVYISAGTSPSGSEGVIVSSGVLRSMDKGETFTDMNIPGAMWADQTKGCQSTLCLDPNNSNILYAVCPLDGLYRTQNAKDKVPVWERLNIPGFQRTTAISKAVICVIVDPREVSGGKSSIIYTAVNGQGIYKSADGGASFELLPDSPKSATQLRITSDGALYAKVAMAEGAIVKYDGKSWMSVAPYKDREYTSFDINPFDEKMMVSATKQDIYFTDNAGLTWRSIKKGAEKVFQAPWQPDSYFANYVSFIYFDPVNNKTAWFGDWFGVWKTEDVTAEVPKWHSVIRGLEEFCVRTIKPTNGKARIFIGAMDNNGITSTDVFDFPNYRFDNPWCQDTNGIDFAEKNPDIVVRNGGMEWGTGPGDGGYSLDGGITWTPFETYPLKLDESGEKANNGYIAVAAEANDNGAATIIAVPTKHYAYRTTDWGKSWTKIESLPQNLYADFNHYNEPIESDCVNKDVFYAYDVSTGSFYLSQNGGESFKAVSKLPKADYKNYVLSVPEKEGELFVAIGGEGLWYSKNYGRSFEKITSVSKTDCFSIGKEAPGSDIPTLYIFGTVDGVRGIYRSVDYGKSWEKIKAVTDDMRQEPNTLKADRKDFGVIYMVKGGTGVYMGIPSDLDIKAPRVIVNTRLDGQTIRDKSFEIEGTVTESAKVYCSVNGNAYEVSTDANNRFVINAELKEGENTAVFYAVDKMGYKSKEVSYTFTHDPKYIGLTLDQSSGICMQKSFTMTGSVSVLNSERAVSVNGQKILVNPKTKGFSYNAPILEGINSFEVTAWDDTGNTVSETIDMNFDTIAPSVTFENAGITTDNVLYLLKGIVSEPCAVVVGDYGLQIQQGDSLDFEIPLQLAAGENSFNVILTDPAGNKAETKVNAVYQPKETVPQTKNEVIVYSTATGIPQIDGKIADGEWYLNRVAGKVLSGTTKAYSVFGMKGDSKYLYFATRVWDDTFVPGTEKDYALDTYELYFDPELNRAEKYDDTDKQLRLGTADNSIKGIRLPENARVACEKTEDGYVVEAAIPWDELGIKYSSGVKFGFDVSANDNNQGEGKDRDGAFGWAGTADNYRNTSAFGTAVIE